MFDWVIFFLKEIYFYIRVFRYKVFFDSEKCVIKHKHDKDIEHIGFRENNVYMIDMKQQLFDYGIVLDHIPIKCDNTSAINLSKNPILHSRTKHIEIRHP